MADRTYYFVNDKTRKCVVIKNPTRAAFNELADEEGLRPVSEQQFELFRRLTAQLVLRGKVDPDLEKEVGTLSTGS